MTPQAVIILIALGGGGVFLWKARAKFHSALSAVIFRILDSIFIGYIIYLIVAVVIDFGAFESWPGAARILFFYAAPTGRQYFAMFVGAALGYLNIFQPKGGSVKNFSVYRGGRRLRCHKSALRIANSILAARADQKKLRRPHHLETDENYDLPKNEGELDVIEPLENAENNLALTPYACEENEYDTVSWGMIRIPFEETENHFLAVGATGSGKTLMIHGLMKSVLWRIERQKDFRAFVYDDKPDFLAFARQIGVEKYVWNFDPFDVNGMAWDIASDVTSYAEALQVASVLAPLDPGLKEPFFQQAVEGILAAVFISFLECSGRKWTLRDVLLSFSNQARLKKILQRHPASVRISELFLGAKKSFPEVLASARTKLGPYEIAAALWSSKEEKGHKKSMREWHETNAIALVRSREIFSQAVKPINQALFRMASLLLLNQEDTADELPEEEQKGVQKEPERSCWIFLDEIREIGRLEGYHALANKGRSKGVRLVLGFQSIVGMRAEHGNDNIADEIAEICGNRTFLHLDCVKTREWAANHMGNIVVDETVFTHSQTYGKESTSGLSWQTKRESRPSMESSDFNENLKKASPENGVIALNTVPFVGTYISTAPWSWVLKNFPRPKRESTTLHHADDQKIKDWDADDLKRLGLPPDFLIEVPEVIASQETPTKVANIVAKNKVNESVANSEAGTATMPTRTETEQLIERMDRQRSR